MPTPLRQRVAVPAFSGPRSRASATTRESRAVNTAVPRLRRSDREWGLRPQAPPPPATRHGGTRLEARLVVSGAGGPGVRAQAPFAVA